MRTIIVGAIIFLIVLSVGLYKVFSHKPQPMSVQTQPQSKSQSEIKTTIKKVESTLEEVVPQNLSVYENIVEKIVSAADNVSLVAWATSNNDRNVSVSAPNQEFLRVYVQCVEYNKSGVAGVEKRDCNKVHNKSLTTLLFRQ